MEVSYGCPGTLHRSSIDAREALRAEMKKRDRGGEYRDIEAAQGEARDKYGERRNMLVMGKIVPPPAPDTTDGA